MKRLLLAALLLTATTYNTATAATTDDTTDSDGHSYVKGLCTADHDCSARYVMSKGSVPSQDGNYVYQLNSAQDFFYWAEMVRQNTNSATSSKAQLNVDVDLSLLWTNSTTPTSWTPLGTSDIPFKGTFDGGSHSIKNLYINNSSLGYVGLFGSVINSTISNLYVKATTINGSTATSSYGGIFAATASGVTFKNCYTYATTVTTNCTVFGGIAGVMQNGTIENCYNLSAISSQPIYKGNLRIGGIVGISNPATLTHCFNQGKITITPQVTTAFKDAHCGGIVGNVATGTTFTRCYASAAIVKPSTNLVTSSNVGVFAGYAPLSSSITYSDCYGLESTSSDNARTLVGYSSSSNRSGLSMLRPSTSSSTDYAYAYTVFGSSVLSDDEGGIHNEFIFDTDGTSYIDNVIFYNSPNDSSKPMLVKKLVLTDGTPYAANTRSYYAESFSFARDITEGNTFSFILPMEILSANVPEGCPLYLLSSINTETNTLYFEPATFIQAHYPYLVVNPTVSTFNISATNVSNAHQRDMTNVKSSGNVTVTHTGSYLPKTYTADETNSYYGYKDGKFVKAKKSHLKPFRTMLQYITTSSSETAPLAFNVSLDGETTGIISPTLESRTVDVYDLSGQQLRHAVSSVTALRGLPRGIYIVGGQKVVKQ